MAPQSCAHLFLKSEKIMSVSTWFRFQLLKVSETFNLTHSRSLPKSSRLLQLIWLIKWIWWKLVQITMKKHSKWNTHLTQLGNTSIRLFSIEFSTKERRYLPWTQTSKTTSHLRRNSWNKLRMNLKQLRKHSSWKLWKKTKRKRKTKRCSGDNSWTMQTQKIRVLKLSSDKTQMSSVKTTKLLS